MRTESGSRWHAGPDPKVCAGPDALPDEDALALSFRDLAGPAPAAVRLGIGDDAALLAPAAGHELVWTVDTLEEDVDFRRAWLTPAEAGARAVAAAFSDLAAMGARPLASLLSLGSDAASPSAELLALFRGAAGAARGWGGPVVGGDLTRRVAGVGVTVTALGTVPSGGAFTRAGARPGHELWVTGRPGLAGRGLLSLERWGRQRAEREVPEAVERWARPVPRVAEADWLREQAAVVSAAIDLSDGLTLDLGRLCSASGVGARLEESALRTAVGSEDGRDDLEEILAGGEDFELLLAVRRGAMGSTAPEFRRRFGLALTRVGELTGTPGLVLRASGGAERALPALGWNHVRGSAGPREARPVGPHGARGEAPAADRVTDEDPKEGAAR